MKKLKKELIKKAALYARDLFARKKNNDLSFHDFRRTKRVVRYADRIAANVTISKNDYIVLMVAAWLHDLEYVQRLSEHEEKGVSTTEHFFSLHNVNPVAVHAVRNTILSTRVPQKPVNVIQDILCDSDLSYFGSRRFMKRINSLRKENQRATGKKINKVQWLSETVLLVESHVYFTDFARRVLRKGVKRNLEKLKARQRHVVSREVGCTTNMLENEK